MYVLESQQQPRGRNLAAGGTVVQRGFRMIAFIFNGWSNVAVFSPALLDLYGQRICF